MGSLSLPPCNSCMCSVDICHQGALLLWCLCAHVHVCVCVWVNMCGYSALHMLGTALRPCQC